MGIFGGDGDDKLQGGAGDDVLAGGGGNKDIADYSTGYGVEFPPRWDLTKSGVEKNKKWVGF